MVGRMANRHTTRAAAEARHFFSDGLLAWKLREKRKALSGTRLTIQWPRYMTKATVYGGGVFLTDSTIAPPPKASDFLQRTVHHGGCSTDKEDATERKVSIHILVCKGLSIDDVGVSRDTVFSGDTTGSLS